MSLAPPPLQAWQDMPPVWKRWFLSLFDRIGGIAASSTTEIEELLASGSDSGASSDLQASFAELEQFFASNGDHSADISDLRKRIESIERLIES